MLYKRKIIIVMYCIFVYIHDEKICENVRNSESLCFMPFYGLQKSYKKYGEEVLGLKDIKNLSYLEKKKLFSERMLMSEKSYAKALNHPAMSNLDKDRFRLKRYKKMCYDSNLPIMYYDIPNGSKRAVKDIMQNGIEVNANISFWVKHNPQAKEYLPYLLEHLQQFSKDYCYMLVDNTEHIIECTRCRFVVQPCFSIIFQKLLCFLLVDFMCVASMPNASELLTQPLKSLHKNKKSCD